MTEVKEGDAAAMPGANEGDGAATGADEAHKPGGESTANYQADMARMQAAGNMGMGMGGGLKSLTPEECGGETDKYRWLQSEQEIIVEFEVPKGTKGKQIGVKWTSNTVKISALNEAIIEVSSSQLLTDS